MNEGISYAILGSARSGLAAAKMLRAENAPVFVSDAKRSDATAAAETILREIGAEYEFGGHSARVLDANVLVLSPGVPDTIDIVMRARDKGMLITNELELASQRLKGKLVAIAGTNGKTTTTELIGHMFRSAGRKTFVAGNIGLPVSEIARDTDDDSVTVVETSSFQLEHISLFRPHVAVLLNITPNHLDRYKGFKEYAEAKYRLTMNQTDADAIIINADDNVASVILERTHARAFRFSVTSQPEIGAFIDNGAIVIRDNAGSEPRTVIGIDKIRIRGWHNLYNAMAASLAAHALGVPLDVIADSLQTFAGVPHRLEVIRTIDGVRYVNDSKSTTVDSLWWALESFEEKIVLIAGGRSKVNDYTPILPQLDKHVKAAIVIGDEAEAMYAAFKPHTNVIHAGYDMKSALTMAREQASEGDVVLLSPACASYDMFQNYEDRGDKFKALVNELIPHNATNV